jgi:hypothetical protein
MSITVIYHSMSLTLLYIQNDLILIKLDCIYIQNDLILIKLDCIYMHSS